MKKCWNCGEKIPKSAKRCPECHTGQNLAQTESEDDFQFTRPDDAGVDSEPEYDSMFMSQDKKKKKGESCPVCGASMSYKERVDSWFCPKCKTFY